MSLVWQSVPRHSKNAIARQGNLLYKQEFGNGYKTVTKKFRIVKKGLDFFSER